MSSKRIVVSANFVSGNYGILETNLNVNSFLLSVSTFAMQRLINSLGLGIPLVFHHFVHA